MNQRKQGIILSYAYTLIHVVISMLYVPMLLGTIGQSEYGLYQMIGSIIAYIGIMEPLLSAGILRHYCKYNSLQDEYKKENVLAISRKIYRVFSIIVILLGLICVVVFKNFYRSSLNPSELTESMIMILFLTANIVIRLNAYIYSAAISANERFVFLKVLEILTTICEPLTILIIIRKVPYAATIVFVQVGINIIVALIKRYYCLKKLDVKIIYHEKDPEFIHDLFTLSVGIFLTAIADQIFWKADQLIIGKMLGTGMVAVYAVGAQIYGNYSPVGVAISGVFMPRLSQLYDREKNMTAISELFIRVGRIAFLALALILSGFILYGKQFVFLWAGENFEAAYYVALVVMIPLTIDVMQNLGLSVLQLTGQYAFRGKMYLTIAVINIVSTILLVRYVGIVGAAASTAVSMLIGNGFIMNVYYAQKVGLAIIEFWKQICKILPATGISFLLGLLIKRIAVGNDFLTLIIQLGVFTVVYFVVNYVVSMNQYEKNLIIKPIEKCFSRIKNN